LKDIFCVRKVKSLSVTKFKKKFNCVFILNFLGISYSTHLLVMLVLTEESL
jgi:hypothetical protein